MEQFIIGIHSIVEALQNPKRTIVSLIITDEGQKELDKRISLVPFKAKIQKVAAHQLQEIAKKKVKEDGGYFSRVPSGAFLIVNELPESDPNDLYELIESKKAQKQPVKLVILDGVTDVHNAAAILRSASFFGVDAIITSVRGGFGASPTFARIASGALEHLMLVRVSGLPKTITKLREMGCDVIGLSEEAPDMIRSKTTLTSTNRCLVFGSEDVGLSNAVERVLTAHVSLTPLGKIKSLNVSVAAALAMENFFR